MIIYHTRLKGFALLLSILVSAAYRCEANDIKSELDLPKIGNFALPTSQQPGPLLSFGENIIDKNVTQFYLFADKFGGVNKHFVDLLPMMVYGISDKMSILVTVPYAVSYREGPVKRSRFEDSYAQLEYAYYSKSTKTYSDQATVLANISLPTGTLKFPATGVGSPSFFLGTTFNRSAVDWFAFTSHGVILTTSRDGIKVGNSVLYQGGLGRNIADTHGWIFAWMVELDGFYLGQSKGQGLVDRDSGGNIIFATPSLWASNKHFIFQFGAGLPVSQHFFGAQTGETFLLAANFGWSIW